MLSLKAFTETFALTGDPLLKLPELPRDVPLEPPMERRGTARPPTPSSNADGAKARILCSGALFFTISHNIQRKF